MSHWIRISTVGAAPANVSPDASYATAVDEVGAYLLDRVAQVLPDKPDLIVLPEVCDRPGRTGWDHARLREYYEVRGNRIRDRLAEVAARHRCFIAYSAVRRAADGAWRNSTVLIDRAGRVAGTYNKNHVVIEENTEQGILYGRAPTVIDCELGRVGFAICFDLNFDELRLQYAALKPDLILFCSVYHGGLMQPVWAYSCRCHFVSSVAGVSGSILSPQGETIARSTNYFDFVTAPVNLDCRVAHLDCNWEKLKALKAKYGPRVKVTDPGFLGSVLISAEDDGLNADALVREFGIELLDDYFARCRAHRREPGRGETVP
jgi:predicted amidohydrolase